MVCGVLIIAEVSYNFLFMFSRVIYLYLYYNVIINLIGICLMFLFLFVYNTFFLFFSFYYFVLFFSSIFFFYYYFVYIIEKTYSLVLFILNVHIKNLLLLLLYTCLKSMKSICRPKLCLQLLFCNIFSRNIWFVIDVLNLP